MRWLVTGGCGFIGRALIAELVREGGHAVRVVDDMDQAIDHIQRYGSNHTEVIVTNDYASGREFLRRVNSGTVGINCSTAFADGYRLGLGAEIGISTSKLHAYGPMGLEGLTTLKFVLFGDGQSRE